MTSTTERAAALLQAAHDRIEAAHFNIDTYGEGPACYIGTLRICAGIGAAPGIDSDPAEGDGPELRLALEAMDRIALRRLPKRAIAEVEVTRRDARGLTGRFVEALGFEIRGRFANDPRFATNASMRYSEYEAKSNARRDAEQAYALRLLRRALSEIHA